MTQTRTIPTLTELRARRDEVLRIAAAHGASNVRVIGSVARGDAIPESDFDLLVDFDREARGFAYFGRMGDLQRALAELFGRPVDIVVYGHTHIPLVETFQGVLLVNPGSPTLPKQVRKLGTVGLLELTKGNMDARIVDLKEF